MWIMPGKRPENARIKPEIYRDREQVHKTLRAAMNISIVQKLWPLTMHGQPGTGKTCAALSLTDYCGWAIYEKMQSLMATRIQASKGELYTKGQQPRKLSERDYLTQLERMELVIVDEVGMSDVPSSYERQCLHELLDARENKATILITNRTLKEISVMYGEAILSRILGGNTCECDWEDRRIACRDQAS